MDAAEFKKISGYVPEYDDLERTNCRKAGTPGHSNCGICPRCGAPRFLPPLRNSLCSVPGIHEEVTT